MITNKNITLIKVFIYNLDMLKLIFVFLLLINESANTGAVIIPINEPP